MPSSSLFHQSILQWFRDYLLRISKYVVFSYYMKKSCDFQSPERSKNKTGVRHIYHIKLHLSLNPPVTFSWKESYRYYCNTKETKRLAFNREQRWEIMMLFYL